MRQDYLLEVRKPGQYTGGEWNAFSKPFEKAGITFALCFPDLYEVGMSNVGMRIIYDALGRIDDVACERFFSPGMDLEHILRTRHEGFTSLESGRRLGEFDCIGFCLSHELNYTNVLNMLELGNIALLSEARNAQDPLVIGGGPCTLNPEPLHAFFDAFVIGEGEEVAAELIDVLRRYKTAFRESKMSKAELLQAFAGIEGVYVPSLYKVSYDEQGRLVEFAPKALEVPAVVKKRFVPDLESTPYPTRWMVPYVQIIHDRAALEIMRGCPNRCRFCQARTHYFPYRLRTPETIMRLAKELYRSTGYEEISLFGLSVSDYPGIEGLVESLVDNFKEEAVSLSLPSMKPRLVAGRLSSLVARIKKTGLTFAPEAATERLRSILGKDFDEEGFFKVLQEAFVHGYQNIKLYFMIGLPSEEESDIEEIVRLGTRVSEARRKAVNRPARISLSVNALIPRPHTPFQWMRMEDRARLQSKFAILKERTSRLRFSFSYHNLDMSFLEAVLARGDRRLSGVILHAFTHGARFDAWQDMFRFDLWEEAFRANRISPVWYVGQRHRQELLPWDFLDTGVSKSALRKEADAAGVLNDTSPSTKSDCNSRR
ncbi:MAG: TIGR03960 family B12-binding radical SAM protein [Candidatus Omnitrophica bacterium]|nr:TIGR03960 family B12-binding radical SAM protein [Candidatus Omnitrophota bacterium]